MKKQEYTAPPAQNPYYGQGPPPPAGFQPNYDGGAGYPYQQTYPVGQPPGYQPPQQPNPYQYPPPVGQPPGGYYQAPPNVQPPPYVDDPEAQTYLPKNAAVSFSEASIRRGFIRKVYCILMFQLLVVFGFCALTCFESNTKLFIRTHPYMYWVSYGVFLVTYIALVCCQSVRRKFPGNFICLVLLTLAIAYMTGMISGFYNTRIVFIAMGICAGCCIGITLFALNTKYDFTSWVGVLFVVFMVVFLFGLFAIIFRSEILYVVYASLMALVFMVYLAIDTQLLLGGKRFELSPEDYIYASTQLFLDVVYIFWFILQILGYASNKS